MYAGIASVVVFCSALTGRALRSMCYLVLVLNTWQAEMLGTDEPLPYESVGSHGTVQITNMTACNVCVLKKMLLPPSPL